MEPENWFQSSICSIAPLRGKISLNFASCEDCPYEERLNAYKSEDRSDLVDARADLNLALTQSHYSKVI